MTIIDTIETPEVSKLINKIAKEEEVDKNQLKSDIISGKVVVPKNINHKISKVRAVGKGLTTKINANIGTSQDNNDVKNELKKLQTAVKYGADSVMDLSTAGNLDEIRKIIIENSPVMVGTVPIYQAVIEAVDKFGSIKKLSKSHIFDVLHKQAEDGVDFFTVHSGINNESLNHFKNKKRMMNIVSRGGSFITEWMLCNKKDNPFYEYFDEIVSIAKKYDITLSLGDGMRPGSLFDATDRCQVSELIILGDLSDVCLKNKVQVMIEGPGHVPLNDIAANMMLEKRLCNDVPFYVLGPLVVDTAPGYDHITSAIGAAIAGAAGADFLCYVTPAEHLKLPDLNDVKEGVVASKIAAEAADIAKGNKKIIAKNYKMNLARKNLDWNEQKKYAIDKYKISKYRKESDLKDQNTCSMCAEFCAIKTLNKFFE